YLASEENDGGRSHGIPCPRQDTPTAPSPSAVGSVLDGERLIASSSSNTTALNGVDLSPQPDDSTAKGDTPLDKQPYGDSEVGGPFATPTPSSAPLADTSTEPVDADATSPQEEIPEEVF